DRGGRFDKKGREEGFEKDKFNGPKRESKFNKNEKDNKSKKFSERNVFHEEKPQKPVEDYEKNFITPKEFEKTVEDKPKFAGIRSKQEDTFDKAFPLGAKKVSGPFRKKTENADGKPAKPRKKDGEQQDEPKEMTLNKYISHSGTCSRREAAEMVKQGKVKVNGELALDPGYRVQPYDLVTIAGKKLTPQKNRVYILLNKPKGYITTTDDPEGRDTVMDLVEDATTERLYPVGRLDRNTTGLILLTNDGDLAQKLSHPSYETKKVYQVTLDKPLTKIDFEKILAGLTLEDGEVKVDALSYLDEKNELGIEIHSGRNRIVRRIFESLGYVVEKLDRVMYAGLTKKKLPRGEWRFLEDKEVILLKHFKS
ncbi:MAG: pseudouridine synthase, partial [Flavipsychrobacter sp.]